MKTHLRFLATAFLLFSCVLSASAQGDDFPTVAGAPPKMLLLVHQEFKFGKAAERRKIEVAISRACDQLAVPNSWIDLESISGQPEALFFDPFDSFEQLDTAFTVWGRLFAAHSELARMQEESKHWFRLKERSLPFAATISAIARSPSIYPKPALCASSKFA